MRFVVICERATGEWAHVGMFDIDTDKEDEGAHEAVRQAALVEEQSDHFKACPIDKMTDKRIAYRRRVVGLQT